MEPFARKTFRGMSNATLREEILEETKLAVLPKTGKLSSR